MDYSFGNWIKRRRKALDLTQQELAQRVGCSNSLIFKIESDERRPSRQIAELLAQHLELPADQRDLFLKVARQEKGVDKLGLQPIPDQTISHPISLIPPLADPLIGREFELAEITRLLQEPHCRILTLTGTGGIGKTRLAWEAAFQRQDAFEHGAVFVNLAPLNGREQMVTAIADALGLGLYNASDRGEQLISHLREKEVLLLLDNFEHLLSEADCVIFVSDLLKGTLLVKLLVTSREPLQMQPEWVFDVRGLPVPGVKQTDELEAGSAVRLFVQRARQALVGFELKDADLPAIRQICLLVDGMPLAIGLAAGWIRTLTCAEIAQEIQSNINFLMSSARDLAERHRSIRATFDYSWKLLSTHEQLVLQRSSVFKGGFTREAAERATGASLAVLSALASKSLLQRTDLGRYGLHELVRQYSVEHLMGNEEEYMAAQDRHGEYYASLLERRGDGFKGMDQPTIAAELGAEIANLRQAWRWISERGQTVQIGQAADTFFWLYESRGDFQEGVVLFGYAARHLGRDTEFKRETSRLDEMRGLTRARVMAYQGFFCLRQGLHLQSKGLLERSLALLRSLVEGGSAAARDALSNTLAFLGMVTAALGDYKKGNHFLHEGLEIKLANNDRWGTAFCLRQLGLLTYYRGKHDEAYRLLSEALEVSRALGSSWAIAYSLNFLSTAAYALGRYSEAEKLLHEGLALSKQAGDRFTMAYALNGLGSVKNKLGEPAEARRLLEESISIWREIGDQESTAKSLNNLGFVLLMTDNQTEALEQFLEAFSIAKQAQLAPVMLDALLGYAILQMDEGEHESALKMLILITNHPAGMQTTQDRAEALRIDLETKFTSQQIDRAHSHAASMTLETILQELMR
jgi:predicted ATPase/DNA-binding XRE family transcriptional regulator